MSCSKSAEKDRHVFFEVALKRNTCCVAQQVLTYRRTQLDCSHSCLMFIVAGMRAGAEWQGEARAVQRPGQ